ncbi:hypothetical protein VPHD472_0103 [Vibrio phage D472]
MPKPKELTKSSLSLWCEENNIKYNVTGYSFYILHCSFYFRMDADYVVTYYTSKPYEPKEYTPALDALIQTHCLLWGINYKETRYGFG